MPWFIVCCMVSKLLDSLTEGVLCSEEESRMVELAIMGGYSDSKFIRRTLSSQVYQLHVRSFVYNQH